MGEMEKYFSGKELEQINSQNYFLEEWRGSGNTRDVFKALFKKNSLEKEVAFKITKKAKDIDETSVCTLINLSKVRNPNIHEIEYFRHFEDQPNIEIGRAHV